MLRWALVLVLFGLLTVLTLLLLAGHGPWAGDIIWTYNESHGLHRGDVPVLGAWAVGAVCCALLLRRS